MKYKVEVPMPLMQFLLEKTSQKRNDIKNLLKYQNVWVDGHIETHYAYDLQVGQTVEIQAKKNDMPFVILYEDKEIIAVSYTHLDVYKRQPIRNMGILFYNTLFDENAACHLAIGKGFGECLKNGLTMSKEQLLEKGINDSLTQMCIRDRVLSFYF